MPSDEELQAMTGLDDLQMAARMDMQLLEAWVETGFSREEAFALLIALKRSSIEITHQEQHG